MRAKYLSLKPLVSWREINRPLDWEKLFGRQARLEVEIGFGNGERLVRDALENPETDFVGLERSWRSVKRCLRRIARSEADNVRLFQIDARVALERLFKPQTLSHSVSLFPGPWPFNKEAKRRLFSHPFLRLLNSRLRPGAEALIVTDHQPYLEWILEQARDTGFEPLCRQGPASYGTKYERKAAARGQTSFFELRLRKEEHVSLGVVEDAELQTYHVENFDPERFSPVDETGPLTVLFQDFIFDPKRQKGMVRALVAEEGLTQTVWIEISRNVSLWHIRLAPGSWPVPTLGVQRALDLIGRPLLD